MKHIIKNYSTKKTELTESQKRLIKTIETLIVHVSSTNDESDFFEGSAELMRAVASVIQLSQFNEKTPVDQSIPYDEQAVEFALDTVQEYMRRKSIITYDN